MLDRSATEKAAQLLYEVRRNRQQIDALPEDLRSVDLEGAYAVQQRLVELLGVKGCGWFLGGTNDTPYLPIKYATPILEGNLHASPAELSAEEFITFDVDVEFGFKVACEVSPRKRTYEDDESAALVASIHPALDIVSSHYTNLDAVDWPSIIADNGTDGAIVYGAGVESWQADALADHEVTLWVNGEASISGVGSQIMGNPLSAFTWFVNHMSQRGLIVPAGTFVSTGSCTDIYEGKVGDHVKADFGVFGTVEARYVE